MARFEVAQAKTKAAEGGYSNDPTDRGGETLYGISRVNNPTWRGWELVDIFKKSNYFIKSVTTSKALKTAADDFYEKNYWDALRLWDVQGQDMASAAYDMAVNCGIVPAIICIQRAANFLNRSGDVFDELVVDGRIGEKTISAMNALYLGKEEEAFVVVFQALRLSRYVDITEDDGKQDKYARGWLNRLHIKTEAF